MMHRASLLPFQQEIVQELNASDALCILAAGVGWTRPVSVFLRAHAVEPNRGAVVLLGCSDPQKKALEEELGRQDPVGVMPVDFGGAKVPPSKRQAFYNAGHCCHTTSRLFVNDLLEQNVQPTAFAGVLVFNAEDVSLNSGTEFAVRLFRSVNANGFVHAISDNPISFASGFPKVVQVMRELHLRRLCLWPRSHRSVKADLERSPIRVIEAPRPMTSAMSAIQQSVEEIMMVLINELKNTRTMDWSGITAENILSETHDGMIQRRLNSDLTSLPQKTKNLVKDLKELRLILWGLVTLDAVDFLSLLEMIPIRTKRLRIMFKAVFEEAKKRVFLLGFEHDADQKNGKRKTKDAAAGRRGYLHPVLEPLPKWEALKDLLSNIQQEIQTASDDSERSILVVCKDMSSKNRIKLGIQDPEQLLRTLFDAYVESSRQMGDQNEKKRRTKKKRVALKCDLSMLVEKTVDESKLHMHPKKRRTQQQQKTQKSDDKVGDRDEEAPNKIGRMTSSSLFEDKTLAEDCESDLLHNVHFYALDAMDDLILSKLQPDFVIFYHLDVAFLRMVEVFQAENSEKEIKLYHIYYDNSIEKTMFTAVVQREADVFSDLSENRELVAIPLDTGERHDLAVEKHQEKIMQPQDDGHRRKIIVDAREFMSKFPATLHGANFQLVQTTLKVGDYILTPDIVVERKTVSDFNTSFVTRRIFHQAEAMIKHFATPVLLIELDGRQFHPECDHEIGSEISSTNIISRLVFLIHHFPTLGLIWSSSAQETCRVFDDLKRDCPEPPDPLEIKEREKSQTGEAKNWKTIEIPRKLPEGTEFIRQKLIESVRSFEDSSEQSFVLFFD